MRKRTRKYITLTTPEGRDLFYSSPEWSAMRKVVLNSQPFCIECLKEGKYVEATQVDHLIDIKIAPDRCLDITNLQGLCKHHHSQKTFRENNKTSSFGKPKVFVVVNKKWNISLN